MEYNEFIHRLKASSPASPDTEEIVRQVHTFRPHARVSMACAVAVAAMIAWVLLVPQSQSQAKNEGQNIWIKARPANMSSGEIIPCVEAYLHTQQLKAKYNIQK